MKFAEQTVSVPPFSQSQLLLPSLCRTPPMALAPFVSGMGRPAWRRENLQPIMIVRRAFSFFRSAISWRVRGPLLPER